MFKWVPATYCLGVTLRWARIRHRGKQQYSYAYFMLRKPAISSSRVRLWLVCAFTHCTLLLKYREIVFSFSLRKFNNPEVTKTATLVSVFPYLPRVWPWRLSEGSYKRCSYQTRLLDHRYQLRKQSQSCCTNQWILVRQQPKIKEVSAMNRRQHGCRESVVTRVLWWNCQ